MDSDLAAPSFGTLLKQFRQRRQLTQLALAFKIGKKSRGSIQAWEGALFLPSDREIVLILAKVLLLAESETDALLLAAHHQPQYLKPGGTKATLPVFQSTLDLEQRRPFMAEDLPVDFVPRPGEFDTLVSNLLSGKRGKATDITVALCGTGGFGKTTLAKALCHDAHIREAFVDGILWVTLGENPGNIVEKIEDLIYTLNHERPGFTGVDAASAHFAKLLAERDLLLVIDDAWNVTHLRPFLRGGKHCARLITTRDRSILPLNAQCIQVDAMHPEEAFKLLSSDLDHASMALRDTQTLRTLVARLGEWPLLLALVNGVLRERIYEYRQPLSDALIFVNTALDKLGLTAFDRSSEQERNLAVKATLQVSFGLLKEDEYLRYRELAVFPEDIDVPLVTLHRLWGRTGKLDDFRTEELCARFHRLSLLFHFDPVKRMIRLHDVIRIYLRQDVGVGLRIFHRYLLDTYALERWAELSREEEYLWDYLAYHLVGADRIDALIATVKDLGYLATKAFVRSAYATIMDLIAAAKEKSDDEPLRLLQRSVTNMSHLLNRCKTVDEVRAVIHSRLAHLTALADSCHALESELSRPFITSWQTLPELPHPALIRTFDGHTDGVMDCAVSASGDFIVSASVDETLKVWDVDTGVERLTLRGHTSAVGSCAISPLGDYIISTSLDEMKVWDAQTGTQLATLRGHAGIMNACAISPSGGWIVSASEDGTLKIWDAYTWHERATLQGHADEVNSCAVSPQGDYIVSASDDKTLKIWDPSTGSEQLTLFGHEGAVNKCAIDVSGKSIVSTSDDGTLKVWDRLTGKERLALKAGKPLGLYACAISPAGDYLFSGSDDGAVKVWDASTGERLHTLSGHTSVVWNCAVSPKGNWIVSSSDDETLKMWDISSKFESPTNYKSDPKIEVDSCIVSPSGRYLVFTTFDSTIRIWNAQAREELLAIKLGSLPGVCAVHPLEEKFVTKSKSNTLTVRDMHTGQELLSLQDLSGSVTAYTFSPSGDAIISLWDNGTLKVSDALTGEELLSLCGHTDRVNSCAISPAGNYIVSAANDNTLKIWDTLTGEERLTLRGHTGHVLGCAVSSTGDYIVSASEDRTLRIWDAQTGKECSTLHGHTHKVNTCAVSPSGTSIVSTSWDRTMRLWSIQTGECLATLHLDSVLETCAFYPDGGHIAAGGRGGLYFLRLIS